MPNRLANETSPYLQQHADNPVEWYPWGPEALERARSEDKPILLSIGYSACHWCHVMAHESFEDTNVAAEMNREFVNIKVDREERPDLDQIYQTAHQLLTRRSGGWPLTVFLTPAGVPFFAGTYFPKLPRYGMPGFAELLAGVAAAYREKRSEIEQQNASLLDALQRAQPAGGAGRELTLEPIDAALRQLGEFFDDVHGGIGRAPKFPHPCELAFCLRRHALERSDRAAEIVMLTLSEMAKGGMYDQLGGGFFRYSTDAFWTIPHFEKMLYDNGLLLALYADAWVVTRDSLYERVVRETAGWVTREMQAKDGGYYSSVDADSEGIEGKFYIWTSAEVASLLTPDEYAVASRHYGLDGPPNFEGRFWHLRVNRPLPDIARELSLSDLECSERLDSARAKLFTAREQRIRPGRDEKVLTGWNALTIKGMARAGRLLGRSDWLASARRAADFVRTTLWNGSRLLATYKDGRAHLNAYLDDHAFLLDAMLELMQAEFRREDFDFARALAEVLLEHFEDRSAGGFYFVSDDHEPLIHRPKTTHDGATPSGNGVAAYALQRLGHLTGEHRWLEAAERAIRLFYPALCENAISHTTLATALEDALRPPRTLVLRGIRSAAESWRSHLDKTYRPDLMVFVLPAEAHGLAASLSTQAPDPLSPVSGWLCSGVTCQPPVFELAEVERALASESPAGSGGRATFAPVPWVKMRGAFPQRTS